MDKQDKTLIRPRCRVPWNQKPNFSANCITLGLTAML